MFDGSSFFNSTVFAGRVPCTDEGFDVFDALEGFSKTLSANSNALFRCSATLNVETETLGFLLGLTLAGFRSNSSGNSDVFSTFIGSSVLSCSLPTGFDLVARIFNLFLVRGYFMILTED